MDSEPDSKRPREVETITDLDSDPGDARKLSTVGRYVVLDSVGMGGMGLVCAAYDPKLNRKIALKLLRNASNDEASTAGRNRLFREAQALAKLSHPNVVTVHDVDVFEGQVYIAMEFVEGTTLREWLRDEPRTWKEILEKFILAGRGLEAAHAADIIHRDFKPSNVLISNEGAVRVADFGVAKEHDKGGQSGFSELEVRKRTVGSAEGEQGRPSIETTAEDALIEEIQSNVSMELTVAGRMVGTPAYMAPEQHMGLRVGPFTDQYAFCVSFYEALYGRLPFEGTDRRDQLARMTEGTLPPPPKEGPARNVPSWLHKVLARGLRPHPAERWPSMTELLGALERDPIKRIRRAAIASVAAIAVLAGGFAAVFGTGDERVDMCEGVGDEVEEHWNAQRKAQLEAAFERSSKPYASDAARRVTETLSRWAQTWRTQRVEICEATHVVGLQSETLLDVRINCLDRRAEEFEALLAVFAEADDEIVERSVSAAHNALIDPSVCATVQDSGESLDAQLDSVTRQHVADMAGDLDRAYALAALEKHDEALPLQSHVVMRARELPHERTLARGLFDLSQSQLETGDKAGAELSLREAITIDAKLGDARAEGRAWTRLAHYVGFEQNRPDEGAALLLAASSAIVRAGGGRELDLHLHSALGALAISRADYEAAIEHYEAALEAARAAHGEDHPETIGKMVNLGMALARAEHPDEAEEMLSLAMSRVKEVYGGSHPLLANVYMNLGNVQALDGQFGKAEASYRQALSIREQIGGPDSPSLATPLHALADLDRKAGRLEEALAGFERTLSIFKQTKGESSNQVATAYTSMGATQRELGRFEDARRSFDRVEAIYEVLHSEPHVSEVALHLHRCELFVDAHLWTKAVEACETGLALGEHVEVSKSQTRSFLTFLIEAEEARGKTVAAERARARLVELGPEEDDEDEQDEEDRG